MRTRAPSIVPTGLHHPLRPRPSSDESLGYSRIVPPGRGWVRPIRAATVRERTSSCRVMRVSGPDRRFQYVIRAPADSVTDPVQRPRDAVR